MIRARDLGKAYQIYAQPQDRLKQLLLGRFGRRYGREFWALRGVSFELGRRGALGVLGRNGSGKTTLLEVLAGTLQATEGSVDVRGRVAALLELGSGFNPEFTGRENVLLNGAILGLTREQVLARFDQIVAFADIGAFLDQPVKVYSSGMFMRLAFAVATAVDPDLLLIDEALAVGDVFFQQKCFRRLEELRERGTAIVLVSHSPVQVEQFCEEALVLHEGRLQFFGNAVEAVKRYYMLEQSLRQPVPAPPAPAAPELAATAPAPGPAWPPREACLDISNTVQVADGWAVCTAVAVTDLRGVPSQTFAQGERARFFYEFRLLRPIEVPIGGLTIRNERGTIVHGKNTLQYDSDVPRAVAAGSWLRFSHEIALEIGVGEYTFLVGFASVPAAHYEQRRDYTQAEMDDVTQRLCTVPEAGRLAVTLRPEAGRRQLLHHGLANLPGSSRLTVVPSDAAQP